MPGLTPFVYPAIRAPLAGSIADLISREGQPYAQAAVQVADAQARAQTGSAVAWSNAVGHIADAGTTLATELTDPRRKLAQQQVDANQRALGYSQTATKIAQQLVGPNGEQPSPDRAETMMTQAGIPVEHQKPILDSLTAIQNRHKENYADLAHLAYRTLQTLPAETSDEDKNHAVMAALGGAKAFGGMTDADIQQVAQVLAQGHDPHALALGLMGASPSGRYKDIIQDETKPISIGRGGLLVPGKGIVGAPPAPQPTEASLALQAAGGDPATAMGLLKPGPKATVPEQLLGAIAKGDTKTRDTILNAMHMEAMAKRDPDAVAQVAELRKMNAAAAQQRLDDLNPQSTKNQEKLEQEYRGILQREFSSRSGGLGMEDQKVNQALHLLALLDQYEGKAMPSQIHGELALGLAKLTAPNGQVGIELEREFKQKTAQEGVAKAVAWLTGDPTLVDATPEALRSMYRDSIVRQGQVSEQNREQYFNAMKASAPTDLSQERKAKLEGALVLNRMPPAGAPASGTVRNGATWKNGAQGWGWYK